MGVRVREKDGTWWIFIQQHRKRKAKKIGDKKTAEEVARRVRAQLALGLNAFNGSDSPTLREYAAEWLRTSPAIHTKPRTLEYYEGMLRRHILPTLGSTKLGALSRRDMQTLISERAATGLARNTLKGIIATIKVLCNNAIDHEVMKHNPAARLGRFTRGRTEREARRIDAYTADELATLLETAEQFYPEETDLTKTLAWSGLRMGETLGLQYPDLDRHGGFLEVRRTVERRRKGVQITSPKSNRQRRVAIPRVLMNQLIQRHDLAAASAAIEGQEAPLWVFPNRAGKPQHAGNWEKRTWYPLLNRAGLRHLPPHALRHTYASILIQQGESLAFVKQQLGHASIQTTVDIYGHLVPGESRAGIEQLPNAGKRNRNATDESVALRNSHVSS